MFKVYTPLRVDLCGGVTDIAEFSTNGICITNLALDLYTDRTYKIKRQICTEFKNRGADFDVKVVNDFPISTGLGGSAVFIVEIIAGLFKHISNQNLETNAETILKLAQFYETEKLNIKGGFQDYIAAFFGGLNFINFSSLNNLDKKYLGLQVESEILNYLNENMLVLILKENNKSSSEVVTDQINNFKQNKKLFINKLNKIKKCNREVFNLLISKGDLKQRLSAIGKLMNKSWNLQKQLSKFLGKGLLNKLELELKPFVFGVRSPGAGVNSLFLILKKDKGEKVFKILEAYKDLIYIFYAQVNTSGLQIIT